MCPTCLPQFCTRSSAASNPGRVSAAARAHFANPRNDFWRLLHDAGFTSRLLAPHEQFSLLDFGYGLTNAAYRTTPGSGDLRRGDFAGSAERLARDRSGTTVCHPSPRSLYERVHQPTTD